jgi:hypothetical protein
MMTDEELLQHLETKVIEVMLNGCETDDHLGKKPYNVGGWTVTLRADTVSRLIDMAREARPKETA